MITEDCVAPSKSVLGQHEDHFECFHVMLFIRGHLVYSHLSWLSHCGLTLLQREEFVCASWSPLKKKKNAGREWIIKPSTKIFACEEKATTTIYNAELNISMLLSAVEENCFQRLFVYLSSCRETCFLCKKIWRQLRKSWRPTGRSSNCCRKNWITWEPAWKPGRMLLRWRGWRWRNT